MRSIVAAIAVSTLSVALFAASGAAEPREPFSLDWHAPEECPPAHSVIAAIRALLGPHPDTARPVSARASAWRGEDAAWHVEISTASVDAKGERKVDGPSCRAVADAAALIIAMAVDPDAVAASMSGAPPASSASSALPPPAPPPSSSPAASIAPPSPRPPAPPVPPAVPTTAHAPSAPSTRFGGAVAAAADLGALPSLSPGWSAGVLVAPAPWRVAVAFQSFSSRDAAVTAHPSAGGHFELWTAGADACRDLVTGTWSAALCAGVETGKLSAVGYGVRAPSDAAPGWYAGTLAAAIDWRFSRPVSLRSSAGIAFPMQRKIFVIEPYGEVHRAWPISARFSLGPVLLFP